MPQPEHRVKSSGYDGQFFFIRCVCGWYGYSLTHDQNWTQYEGHSGRLVPIDAGSVQPVDPTSWVERKCECGWEWGGRLSGADADEKLTAHRLTPEHELGMQDREIERLRAALTKAEAERDAYRPIVTGKIQGDMELVRRARVAEEALAEVRRDAAKEALDQVENFVKFEAGPDDVYMRADVLSVIAQVRRAVSVGTEPE